MSELNHSKGFHVIHAYLKLSRAMRRCPPPRSSAAFPPAVGRLLTCVAENPGITSRELCEVMDLRPSSLSEILARAENEKLLSRRMDEQDRRIQHVSLAPEGEAAVSDMQAALDEDAEKKTSCLTEEEKDQFCSLCDRLSEHIEKLALELPEGMMPDRPGPEEPGAEGRGPEDRGPGCRRPEGPGGPGEGKPGLFRRRPDKDKPGRPPLPPGGRFRS